MRSIRAAVLLATALLLPTIASGQGLTPEQALQRMKLPPGFQAGLVAAEPLVRQPLSMSFDDRGRLWVLQYLQYPYPAGLKPVKIDQYLRIKYDRIPEPPPKGPKGVDRITILYDRGATGRYQKSKDFLSDLNLASGFCLGQGGVWVAQPPYLLFYPDKDGDDVPDGPPEVHLKGFGTDDSHSYANSLQWGPDGWLYGASGSTSYSDVCGYRFCQGVWRYHPQKKIFELFSEGGGNTYGLDFDRQGNVIAGTNWGGYAMLHQWQGAYYIKGFAKHGPLANPHTYGYFQHVPYTGFKGGHVTCGGVLYLGGAYPKEFTDQYIGGNLLSNDIYWHKLEKDGSTFKARHGGDLLNSGDPWFRPVDCLVGPEGAVYLADWHDRRAAHLDPRDNWDKTNGRIYRITYTGSEPTPFDRQSQASAFADLEKLPLGKRSSMDLLKLLTHPNHWYRREARRVLAERHCAGALPALEGKLVRGLQKAAPGNNEEALQALWTLAAGGKLTDAQALLEPLYQHPAEEIRAWVIRLQGDQGHLAQLNRVCQLAREDKSPLVRAQLACTARRLNYHDALPVVAALLERDEDVKDQHIPLLIWWAIETHALTGRAEVLKLFAEPKVWSRPLVKQFITERLARRYAAEGKEETFAACAALLERVPTPADEKLVLGGMEKALEGQKFARPPLALQPVLERLQKKFPTDVGVLKLALRLGDSDALQRARALIADARQPEATRAALMETVGQLQPEGWVPLFLQALQKQKSNAQRGAALAALQAYTDPTIAPAVLEAYPKLPNDLKARARTLLAGRPGSALVLMHAADRGTLNPKDIPLDQARIMAGFKNPELNKLLEKHFGRLSPATAGEKQNKIGYFRYALGKGQGDVTRGALLFEKTCAVCHTLFGKGQKIGPDLTAADRKDRNFLLLHIIDPSAAQRLEYANQIVTTTDGRTLTGVVVEANPEVLVLADVKGQKTSIPRAKIEELASSPISLMPEGLLDPLDDQQVRDLFAYLQSNEPAKTTSPTSPPHNSSRSGEGLKKDPSPTPPRSGEGLQLLSPPLRFGEGAGGRGPSSPPLRFGEGAGGRGPSSPPLRFGEGAGGRGSSTPPLRLGEGVGGRGNAPPGAEVGLQAKKGSLPPLRVCLVSGSEEYKSDASLAKLQKYLEGHYNIVCSRAFATKVDNLPGLENLDKCDVLLLYTRRLQIDGEQLERVKKYCLAGKPIVGLRTASHAFQKWLVLDKDILGGNYKNHYKEGPLTEVKIEAKARNHPVLKGVQPFQSVASLYRNTGIAGDCQLLMTGSIPEHTEPLTWVREYRGGRVFYTSLGHPRDFENENFVRLLVNALYWTARREVPE